MGLFQRRAGRIGLIAAVVLAGFGLLAVATLSTRSERAAQAAAGLITEAPRRDLPRVLDGVVNSTAQVGQFIVVGGEFSQVELSDGTIEDVTGAYAYHIDTGEFIDAFTPNIARASGENVEILAVEASGTNAVFLGGRFGTVDGHPHDSLTLIDVATGEVQTGFRAEVGGAIRTIELANDRLFIGGEFTAVNGAQRLNFAEMNPTTGAVGNFRADVPGMTRTLNVTPSNVLVVAHRGATIGGHDRPGLALIDLDTNSVLPWRTDFYDINASIQTIDADVSPDGTMAVLVANGGDFPTIGRDSAVAFNIHPIHQPQNDPIWIARNFDSTYSVAISNDAVYVGGHFCWVEGPGSPEPWPGDGEFANSNSCFGATPASRFAPDTVARDQIAAFDPATGKALAWNPGSNGLEGVWSLEIIERGLLIGHDGNRIGNNGGGPRVFNVGRHGFLDNGVGATSELAFSPPPPPPPPTTTTTTTTTTVLRTTTTTVAPAPVATTPPPPPTCNGEIATIVGTHGDDVLVGTEGRDVIMGLRGRDRIRGLGGNDVICGNAGADTIDGGPGADTLFGNGGRDDITGGDGADELHGGGGKDRIFGGNGADTIIGGKAADRLFGENGRDNLTGLLGPDFLNGGLDADACFGRTEGRADNSGDTFQACER